MSGSNDERVSWNSDWTEQQEMWGGRPVYDSNGCPANQRIDGGLEYISSVYDEHYNNDED